MVFKLEENVCNVYKEIEKVHQQQQQQQNRRWKSRSNNINNIIKNLYETELYAKQNNTYWNHINVLYHSH